jgi:hypothetical protein
MRRTQLEACVLDTGHQFSNGPLLAALPPQPDEAYDDAKCDLESEWKARQCCGVVAFPRRTIPRFQCLSLKLSVPSTCHCCSCPLLLHGGRGSASCTQGRWGGAERGYLKGHYPGRSFQSAVPLAVWESRLSDPPPGPWPCAGTETVLCQCMGVGAQITSPGPGVRNQELGLWG